MKAEERAERFRIKVIDILCDIFPNAPAEEIQLAAAKLSLAHMEEDNELIKYIGSMFREVK